ncbi:putative JmjC domain, JmjN domain, Zinc finger, C5HC2-type [Plasmopara halstedii]
MHVPKQSTSPSTLLGGRDSVSSPNALMRRHADSQRRRDTNGTSLNGTSRRSGRYKKRRVTTYSDVDSDSRENRKMLKLALAKSVMETKMVQMMPLPQAAVFYPTMEQFTDPIKYIASIERDASRTGICKIIPPLGWNPPFAINFEDDRLHFGTRKQKIHKLQEGHAYGDGRTHTFRSFRANATAFKDHWFKSRGLDPNKITSIEIEQEYWRVIQTGQPKIEVEYANDLDIAQVGSGFLRSTKRFASQSSKGKETIDFKNQEYYRNTGWNLNNLPDAYGSLLRHLGAAINGINVPWLYCGMLFASFCWHVEDNFMSSINYQHLGASKRWYGIPSSDADKFEAVMRAQLPERFRANPDLLLHLTTMVPPTVLKDRGVKVYTIVQQPGEIIVTFPKAYHSGFSEGFNCNEAVNFALPNWIDHGRECVEMYRKYGRLSIFSHDRFVFHFGSTQNLAEYTVADCEILLKELRRLFHEERDYKKSFLTDGLVNVDEFSGDVMLDEQSMKVDDVRQCFRCKHNVFFSGVICSCNPNRLACLRHTKDMCSCSMRKRTLLQWVSTAELRYAIRRVQMKMRALKNQSCQQDVSLTQADHTSKPHTNGIVTASSEGNYILKKRSGSRVRA